MVKMQYTKHVAKYTKTWICQTNIFYINLSIHLFTLDYDTTNKVGTKRAACQAAIDVDCGLLHSLGKEMITEEMVCNDSDSVFIIKQKSVAFQHLMIQVKHFQMSKVDKI